MNRILAVDYGAKRCGLAWSDPLRISINPLETVATSVFEQRIAELIKTGEINEVVFGIPYHKDGTPTQLAVKIQRLIKQFRKRFPEIDFHTIDEAFTSQRASHLMLSLGTKKKKRRQKERVDQMSAVLILRDFLETV